MIQLSRRKSKMAWNDHNLRLFASAGASKQHNTFYDCYNFNPFSGTDHVKCNDQEVEMEKSLLDNTVNNSSSSNSNNNDNKERKRRMRWDQIESLERSFQEEIKLEPERKMKLARELGLHPRKVAVWFQNRRARWKTKQLENLYDALKQEFDVVSREKQKLQEEVMKLKGRLENEAAVVIQGSALCTEAPSAEETVESKSVVISNANILYGGTNYHQISNCNYVFAADDYYNPALASYWGSLPGCP